MNAVRKTKSKIMGQAKWALLKINLHMLLGSQGCPGGVTVGDIFWDPVGGLTSEMVGKKQARTPLEGRKDRD